MNRRREGDSPTGNATPWLTPHDLDRPRLRPRLTHHGYLHLALLAKQLEIEVSTAAPSLTVDLGCGAMPYRSLFPGRYIGLDLATSHGRPDALGAAESTPLRDGSCDLVVSTQQLEHVDNPMSVLEEARRILRPGGTLLLSTHGVWPHHPDPQDLWRWTEEGLVRLVERAGLRVDRVHHQGELFTVVLTLATYPAGVLRRNGGRGARIVAGAVLWACNVLCRPLDGLLRIARVRHLASPSYLVVARRPA